MKWSEEEARVLGSLVEKELTTPHQYPLTIKSLTAACSQASNRDPVAEYDEQTVMGALDELKGKRLVRFVLPSHGRTAVRYRHVLDEVLALDLPQRALLAVLLLRGPQTIGELRARIDRMVELSGLDEVERELEFLASLNDPLASNLGRRPGQKEERWACPMVATSSRDFVPPTQAEPWPNTRPEPGGSADVVEVRPLLSRPLDRRLDDLQSELTVLRTEVSELRHDLNALRASLGG